MYVGIGLHFPEPKNTVLAVTNPTDSLTETKTTQKQTFKRKLSMENYFDVPKILGVKNPV